ncbi:hypothetical protein HPG69_006454 [Diceros bicornis minor]|uniref:Uncharacterized protein n=1 Tax=Diceros bicornis minor TaxID=77932 RepID=A0A7J7EWU7_DICBM|nr:hypothetical protein HPG69_006454 [Diceros bicornis minor]
MPKSSGGKESSDNSTSNAALENGRNKKGYSSPFHTEVRNPPELTQSPDSPTISSALRPSENRSKHQHISCPLPIRGPGCSPTGRPISADLGPAAASSFPSAAAFPLLLSSSAQLHWDPTARSRGPLQRPGIPLSILHPESYSSSSPTSLSGSLRGLSPLCPLPPLVKITRPPAGAPSPLPALPELILSRWVMCGDKTPPPPARTPRALGLTMRIPKALRRPARPEESVSTLKTGNKLWSETLVFRAMPSGILLACLRSASGAETGLSVGPPRFSSSALFNRFSSWLAVSETKEAWGASGAENPSFSNFDVSLTSIYSFTDDLGYQGSQDLTSEEDLSLAESKRPKRGKATVVQMRRNKVKEEDEDDKEDEKDEAEGSPASLPSPRTRQKQYPCSRTCQMRQREHLSIWESSCNMPACKTKSSHWSLAELRQYLCSCCHRRQKSVEEHKPSDSKGRRDPNENGSVPGSVSEQWMQGAPGGMPREGLGRS